MYRIKPKPGYNVIIQDLGLALRSSEVWSYVSKEKFDNSAHAKHVRHLLVIEDANSEPVVETKPVKKVNETIFVSEYGRLDKNPDDVFITQPKEEETKAEVKVEAIKEETVKIKEEQKLPEIKLTNPKLNKRDLKQNKLKK